MLAALQNTAVPHNFTTFPFIDATHHQGAGMLQIDKAVLATSSVTPSKLSLGESEAGPATRTLTVRNGGSSAITYNVSHLAALSSGADTFAIPLSTGAATVAFSASSVSVAGGGTASLDVTLSPSAGVPAGGIYGGYVVFTPVGGGQTLRVPFAGYNGNYQSIQVLTPTASGFPLIARHDRPHVVPPGRRGNGVQPHLRRGPEHPLPPEPPVAGPPDGGLRRGDGPRLASHRQ